MADHKNTHQGSTGSRDVRYFPASEKQRIKDIRSGQGPATKALAAGDKSVATRRKARGEANAALGGQLPQHEFERAAKRAKD